MNKLVFLGKRITGVDTDSRLLTTNHKQKWY